MSGRLSSNGAGPGGERKPLRLGGMALRNGLLIHGPTQWSIAARAPTGEIAVATGRKPDFGGNRFSSVPLLRGPLRVAEAFAVIPIARRALPTARLPFEDPRVLVTAVGTAALSGMIRGSAGPAGPVREATIATLGLLPAVVALHDTDLAAYHGVEHKAIAAYERGDDDPASAPKEHQRCGSNLIGPLLIFSAAGQLIVERSIERPGRLARGVSATASLALAVETFIYAERNPDSPLGRVVHAAGDGIQRLFATREPTTDQLEVGVAALEAVLEAEGAE